MKVRIENDKYGKECMIFPKSAKINDIQDWLIEKGYTGYMFATVINLAGDEFHEIDEIYVNFFHDLADEAIEANGDFRAVSSRDFRKINEYLMKNGTDWYQVTHS